MENEQEQIQFRLANIMILSKNVNELKALQQIKNKEDEIKFNYNFTINIDTKVNAGLSIVIQNVHVIINDIDTLDVLAEFKIAFFFEIIEFDKFISLNKDGVYHIPIQLDSILKPVCISTARGIIYSELRGTYLQTSIMPVIFMTDFAITQNK